MAQEWAAKQQGMRMTSSNDDGGRRLWDPKGLRVILVEDSWHIGFGVKNWLLAWGVEIVGPVATPAEAERLISEQVPDVALVDLNLRGGEWAHNLIDRLHENAVRVIVMTGYSDVQVVPGTVAAILRKPFSEEQLLAALKLVTPDR
jgi:DNA-binding response OmpR family regulator